MPFYCLYNFWRKKKCTKEGKKVAITSLVTDWGSAHCRVGSQAQALGSETRICSMLFCMAWMKTNHQRQGKAVLSRFLKVKPVAPAGWVRDPQWKPRLSVWKEWDTAGSWATMTHTLRRSLRRGHQHQVWSKAVFKPLFLAGAWHFHYLGLRVFGWLTEPGFFSLKHGHQSYYLLSFGSLQVCSLEQRMRCSRAACEERGPSLSLWCREVSERSFNLCCRSIQPA